MNKSLTAIVGAAVIGLAGCTGMPPHDLDGLKSTIDEAQAPEFGTVLTEMHMAEDQLDIANKIADDLSKANAGFTWGDIHEKNGMEAAQKALQHRRNAEAALNNILDPLRQRISYLESLHIEQGTDIPHSAVYFDTGRSEVTASEMGAIDRVVAFLRNYPLFSVTLTGYTDTVGSEAMNKRLAARRNDGVVKALRKAGLPTDTVVRVAVGEAGGPDNTDNRDNRRVDIQLHPHGKYLGQ